MMPGYIRSHRAGVVVFHCIGRSLDGELGAIQIGYRKSHHRFASHAYIFGTRPEPVYVLVDGKN
jgi:hypothetical protein